jgi:hypothetical protein
MVPAPATLPYLSHPAPMASWPSDQLTERLKSGLQMVLIMIRMSPLSIKRVETQSKYEIGRWNFWEIVKIK